MPQRCCPKRLQQTRYMIAKRIRELSTTHGIKIFAAKPGLLFLLAQTHESILISFEITERYFWQSGCAVIYADSSKEYHPTIWPRDLVHLRLLLSHRGIRQVSCLLSPRLRVEDDVFPPPIIRDPNHHQWSIQVSKHGYSHTLTVISADLELTRQKTCKNLVCCIGAQGVSFRHAT